MGGICLCAKEEIGGHVRQPLVLKSWSSQSTAMPCLPRAPCTGDDPRDHLRCHNTTSTEDVVVSEITDRVARYPPKEDDHDLILGACEKCCVHRSESIDALAVAAYSHADRTASIDNQGGNVTEKACDKGLSHASVDSVTPLLEPQGLSGQGPATHSRESEGSSVYSFKLHLSSALPSWPKHSQR